MTRGQGDQTGEQTRPAAGAGEDAARDEGVRVAGMDFEEFSRALATLAQAGIIASDAFRAFGLALGGIDIENNAAEPAPERPPLSCRRGMVLSGPIP